MRQWVVCGIALVAGLARVLTAEGAAAATVSPELQKRVRAATYEVVLKRPEKDSLTYEKPLPLELLPFTERNDKYLSIGTAFAIAPNTYVSAGHVMTVGLASAFGTPALRGSDGSVHPIDKVLKYSQHEDFMVFTVAGPRPARRRCRWARPPRSMRRSMPSATRWVMAWSSATVC